MAGRRPRRGEAGALVFVLALVAGQVWMDRACAGAPAVMTTAAPTPATPPTPSQTAQASAR